jgi:hypothetical protein
VLPKKKKKRERERNSKERSSLGRRVRGKWTCKREGKQQKGNYTGKAK